MDGVVLRLRTADGRQVSPPLTRPRPRVGRLAAPLGAEDEAHVRCACQDCGAHLLGARDQHGHASGVCLVCGGVAVRPL